jgi:hypothetical protein
MIDVLPHRSAVSLHSSKRSSNSQQSSRSAVQSQFLSYRWNCNEILVASPLPFLRQATGPHSTCPISGVKRTSDSRSSMFVIDPKRKSAPSTVTATSRAAPISSRHSYVPLAARRAFTLLQCCTDFQPLLFLSAPCEAAILEDEVRDHYFAATRKTH